MSKNKNTYPFRLEKQLENLYANAIGRLAKDILPKIKKRFKQQEIKTDASFREFINSLIERTQNKIIASGFIRKQLIKISGLVNAWSRARTTATLKKLNLFDITIPKRLIGGKLKPVFPSIELPKTSPLIQDFMAGFIRNNMELVQALNKNYIAKVTDEAINTFTTGGSSKDLTKKFLKLTDEDINRAKFWARDQLGDAYSEFTRISQTDAGIENYIWRTVGDNEVRGNDSKDKTSHVVLEGQTFSWKKGAANEGQFSKPGTKHPGQDYNCRCTAEPTLKK